MTKKKGLRPPGRPRINTPEETAARQRILWRARNRAVSVLIQRHQEEFNQIKDEMLVASGYEPVNTEFQRTEFAVTERTPLDQVARPEREASV